jgi:hypothetical protein
VEGVDMDKLDTRLIDHYTKEIIQYQKNNVKEDEQVEFVCALKNASSYIENGITAQTTRAMRVASLKGFVSAIQKGITQ